MLKQVAYKCKICSDYVVGEYHKLVSCKCDKAWIDVGSMNTRRGGDFVWMKENWEDWSLYKDSTLEEVREKFLWGSYGLDEEGNGMLDIWADKMPQAAKDYYKLKIVGKPFIEDVLTKKQYQEYLDWENDKPPREYKTIKEMDSDHILNIVEGQTQISKELKEILKLELKERGIDASHI